MVGVSVIGSLRMMKVNGSSSLHCQAQCCNHIRAASTETKKLDHYHYFIGVVFK